LIYRLAWTLAQHKKKHSQIEALIYELYGLTEEEIRIVERT
jgi:hypothetical protein